MRSGSNCGIINSSKWIVRSSNSEMKVLLVSVEVQEKRVYRILECSRW